MINIVSSSSVESSDGSEISLLSEESSSQFVYGGERFTKYIIVNTESGQNAYKTTSGTYNTIQSQGDIYASFYAEIGKSELVGETIVSFALSQDGMTPLITQSIVPHTKTATEAIIFNAKLILQITASDCTFIDDADMAENPLILALLGYEDFDKEIQAYGGVCALPNEYGVTDTTIENGTEVQNITIENADSGAVTITIDVPQGSRDVIICYDGVACLRVAVAFMPDQVYAGAGYPTEFHTVDIGDAIITEVSALYQDDTSYDDPDILQRPQSFIKSRSQVITSNFENGYLLTAPDHNFVGIVDSDTLYLVDIKDNHAHIFASLPHENMMIFLVNEREIVLSDGDILYNYVYDEDYVVTSSQYSYDNPCTGDYYATRNDNMLLTSRFIGEYKVELHGLYDSGSKSTLTSTFTSLPQTFLSRHYVGVWTPTTCRFYTIKGYIADKSTMINAYISSDANTYISEVHDEYAIVLSSADTENKTIYEFSAGQTKEFPVSATFKFYGDYFIVVYASGERELYYHDRYDGSFMDVSDYIDDVDTVADFARLGNFALCKRTTGVVEEYMINPNRSYLYHSLISDDSALTTTFKGGLKINEDKTRTLTVTIS